MLSYQHIFHAGNTADIFKHLTLILILKNFLKKEKPFVVFDSHSGNGVYDFSDERTQKTGEAEDGIKKLLKNSSKIENDDEAFEIFRDYLKIERLYLNKNLYAGSPEIERLFMRECDEIHLSELHPESISLLKENLASPTLTSKKNLPKIHIHERDGWETVSSLVPPKNKETGKIIRGLIFMDPSFEDASDYENSAKAFETIHKKWSAAVFALWYPILNKKKSLLSDMKRKIKAEATKGTESEIIDIEFLTKKESDIPSDEKASMIGSGMLIANPPYLLKEKLEKAVNFLKNITFNC